MSANKRIKKSSSRSAKDLIGETAPRRVLDLKQQVHRLEVEIATAAHYAAAHKQHRGGFSSKSAHTKGYGVQQRFTHSQARKHQARWVMQVAMFLTSTCLLAGAGAWLYRLWLSVN